MQTLLLVMHFIICFLLGNLAGTIGVELAKEGILSESVAFISCFVASILLSLIISFFVIKPIYDGFE